MYKKVINLIFLTIIFSQTPGAIMNSSLSTNGTQTENLAGTASITISSIAVGLLIIIVIIAALIRRKLRNGYIKM